MVLKSTIWTWWLGILVGNLFELPSGHLTLPLATKWMKQFLPHDSRVTILKSIKINDMQKLGSGKCKAVLRTPIVSSTQFGIRVTWNGRRLSSSWVPEQNGLKREFSKYQALEPFCPQFFWLLATSLELELPAAQFLQLTGPVRVHVIILGKVVCLFFKTIYLRERNDTL